jgi:hypothetical protein
MVMVMVYVLYASHKLLVSALTCNPAFMLYQDGKSFPERESLRRNCYKRGQASGMGTV